MDSREVTRRTNTPGLRLAAFPMKYLAMVNIPGSRAGAVQAVLRHQSC